MQLIHRTNYWGEYIDPSNDDEDVPFDVIWVQAVDDNSTTGCCPGFGRRRVNVHGSDLKEVYDGWWHIFLVSDERGTRNRGHYFYKFVTLPQSTPGYGKKGCAKLGWRWVGEFHARKTKRTLDDVLEDYLEMYNASDDVHHVHIGIKMDRLYAPRQGHSSDSGATTEEEPRRRHRWDEVIVDELDGDVGTLNSTVGSSTPRLSDESEDFNADEIRVRLRSSSRFREVVNDLFATTTIASSPPPSSNSRRREHQVPPAPGMTTTLKDKENDECVVCMSSKKTHVLVQCGHLCICEGCATSIQRGHRGERKCPICRTVSVQIMKVFY